MKRKTVYTIMAIMFLAFLTLVLVIMIDLKTAIIWSASMLLVCVTGLIGGALVMTLKDLLQTKHTLRANFPLVGRFRYWLEGLGPKMYQYFIELPWAGRPITRNQASNVYQRAKGQPNTQPFGTQEDVGAIGYEWFPHSSYPKDAHQLEQRPHVNIGGYKASLLNVSAMSYGSLSPEAIRALSIGAARGGFYLNTGEGGISPHHVDGEAGLVWQIGTGYFGARDHKGRFSWDKFKQTLYNHRHQIKMIEIKESQGAKPGHGGILPAYKNTPEVANIRGVEPGVEIVSPSAHSAWTNATGKVMFIGRMQEVSEKPVGLKMCLGDPMEFVEFALKMKELDTYPDYIQVDGGEGGTGASKFEYTDHVGAPLDVGLTFVHDTLVQLKIRDRIKLVASSKIFDGFDMVKAMAMGADLCVNARGMMMAVGCIRARECHINTCPTGVATQDPVFRVGLDVEDKSQRVMNYHKRTIEAFVDLLSSRGLSSPDEITRDMVYRRTEDGIKTLDEIYTERNIKLIQQCSERLSRT